MKVTVHAFQYEDGEIWDSFCKDSPMASLLHTRRFLSYHGNRFEDVSLVLLDNKDRLIGLFPAAVDNSDNRIINSHPGVTYGGLVHTGKLRGDAMLDALRAVMKFYRKRGYSRLRYKAVPAIYQHPLMQDDIHALFRLGACRYRCDLSSAIDLAYRNTPSQRRKRSYKKALAEKVKIAEGIDHAQALWEVLTENLARKYGAKPVHSLAEIRLLHERFPDEINFVTAYKADELIAGIVLFQTPIVAHAQYIAASTAGYESSALDLLFEYCIDRTVQEGKRYFDFGICTEENGQYLNTSLYQFKNEFGAGSTVYEFFELKLDP